MVSSAMEQGRRLICVTINAPDDWNDHEALYKKGFGEYTIRTVVEEGQILGQREVVGGDGQQVRLVAKEGFSYAMTATENVEIILSEKEFVYAPVVEGADAGFGYLMLGDTMIGKIPLIYGETIERQQEPQDERGLLQRIFGG